MWKYLLRRVLVMIPALFAVMFLAFLISRSTPGDPVLAANVQITAATYKVSDRAKLVKDYEAASRNLGLDQPIFYFELSSLAYPDTLHRIVNMRERATFAELAGRTGNWTAVDRYRRSLIAFENAAFAAGLPASDAALLSEVQRTTIELRYLAKREDVQLQLNAIDSLVAGDSLLQPALAPGIAALARDFERIHSEAQTWRCYVPKLTWHGWHNQFHHWIDRMLHFDFGTSYIDRRPVGDKILEALPWSLIMGLFSYLISVGIAVPVGVFFVRRRDTPADSVVTTLLFLLHSVPTFVLAMVLMTLFCNPEYLYWFPVTGVRDDMHDSFSFFGKIWDILYHLTLPTLLFSYHGVTLMSRLMRVTILDNMSSDYIRTARAKGVSEKKLIWKHAMRNSLLPLIMSLSNFPATLITGVVIVETIFSVPGMGSLVTQASSLGDHPMIVAVFALSGLLTIIGILFGDLLLALSDPRITFSQA
jgi:ABC-type dipeptide/oligopeptide/nickel transport system permease component